MSALLQDQRDQMLDRVLCKRSKSATVTAFKTDAHESCGRGGVSFAAAVLYWFSTVQIALEHVFKAFPIFSQSL